jgi:predicted acylesterase/phospholipase RssA
MSKSDGTEDVFPHSLREGIMEKPAVAIFSGSGVRFPVYFGVLEALLEHGYAPKTVGGVSGGGLAAGVYASLMEDMDGDEFLALEAISHLLGKMKLGKYIRLCPLEFFRGYLYNRDRLGWYLESLTHGRKFKDLTHVNLKIMATAVDTGEIAVFSKEHTPDVLLWQAIMASSALPLAFPPVFMNGTYYMDGGILQDIPFEEFTKGEQEHSNKYLVYPTTGAKKYVGDIPPWTLLKRVLDLYMSSNDLFQMKLAVDAGMIPVAVEVNDVSSVDFSIKGPALLQEWALGKRRMEEVLA